MKKTLLSLAMTATLGLASMSANATFQDFTVNEGSVPSALPNVFVADKLNGAYTEYLAPTSATTFQASAVANLGQFLSNEGQTQVLTQLNLSPLFAPFGYGLYALFTAAGNITGINQFMGTSGTFSLYIDPNQNTTFNGFNAAMSAFAPPTADAVGSADDYLVAFTTSTDHGSGNLNGPPGAFDIVFNGFTLTPAGKAYFIAPSPFHMIVDVNGDYDVLTPLGPPASPGTRRITGDVSAVFLIPEPGSLALMGLALAGLGLAQRRRSKSAQ